MKNYYLYKLLLSISIIILTFAVVESVNCQPWKKPRPKVYNTYVDTNDFKSKPTALDTVANREFSIDFEKLSIIASVEAYGTKGANINGSVVIGLTVDTNAQPITMAMLESSNKVLNPIALSAIKKYFKKYKPKVAKKDGQPIETKDYLVPIIFDMSIIKNNRQPVESNSNK
jgi:hypothetical protein